MQNFTTPMMKQYVEMKTQHPDCLLLFRLGDFYELFLEDAHVGAKILDITLTSRPKGKDGRIPMAGVPYHAVDSYLSKLVKAGYKVAICEQLSPPNTKGLIERKVIRIVTPGTITDEKSLVKKENNFLITLAFHKKLVGLAAVDLSTGEFLVNQYAKDGWQSKISDELAKLQPSECILSEETYNQPEILKVLSLQKDLNIYRFPSWEKLAYRASSTLKKHFGVQSLSTFNLEDKSAALQASAAILGYLQETQKENLTHLNHITFLDNDDYLLLDRSTMSNLELFSTIRDHEKKGTLIHLLDQTSTNMGGRLLRKWLQKPLNNRQEIIARQEIIEQLFNNLQLRAKIQQHLQLINDLERLLARLTLKIGHARDLIALKNSLSQITSLSNLLHSLSGRIVETTQDNFKDSHLEEIIELIEKNIEDNPSIDLKNGGLIKNGVNEKLDQWREVIRNNQSWLSDLEIKEKTNTGINSLKVRFNSVFGFYIEISKSNLGLVPKHYIRRQTLTNGERYVTPELKEHEELILEAQEKSNHLEYLIWQETLEKILNHTVLLQEISTSLAILDCLVTLAETANKNNYSRPIITDSTEIQIISGRHPVVETLLDPGKFVPNDCFLNENDYQLLVLTGPNMAGKSVYIRQVALIVLLAHIGSFVPAKKASICVVDRIFVRSGAADVITAGLSTFMVEMVETAQILSQATKNSLIVLDEIGRGTSTYDGISIAWAIAQYLITNPSVGAKTLFATHYHELQELEKKFPNKIKNFQMAIIQNQDKPIFLHTLIPGGASHSFGVAVAKLAGIPEEVIKNASKMLIQLESKRQSNFNKTDLSVASIPTTPPNFITEALNKINIDKITPLEALNLLNQLKTSRDI